MFDKTPDKTVAILGLGLMGSAFARHLHTAGMPVVAWNRTASPRAVVAKAGIAVCDSASEAIARASLVILLPGRCDQAATLLAGMPQQLTGKDVLNLASGTPRMVRALGDLVTAAGGRFASGTILCYPDDIGTSQAAVMVSGSTELWADWQAVVQSLAGSSAYLDANPAAASALEAALVGCVVQPAQAAVLEAVRFLGTEGVAPDLLTAFLPSALESVHQHSLAALDRIARADFATSGPPISNYARSQALFVEALHDAGAPAEIASAFLRKLERREAAGDGALDFAVLYRG